MLQPHQRCFGPHKEVDLGVGHQEDPKPLTGEDSLRLLLGQLGLLLVSESFDSLNAVLRMLRREVERFGIVRVIKQTEEAPDCNGKTDDSIHYKQPAPPF